MLISLLGMISAIDVHAHYGRFIREGGDHLTNGFASGDASTVVARAHDAHTDITIVSPLLGLMPRGNADAAAGNNEATEVVAREPGLRQYVIVDPLQPATFEQARAMLAASHCVGIKIHPEEHQYLIADHGRLLFEFFEEMGAPVLTHSGCPNSLPKDFVSFANDFPTVHLILAHLGNGAGDGNRPDLQVRAIQRIRHENVYVDTSSARSVLPGLIEWAEREIGADRILYGTDTPLYFAAMQRARIDHADISELSKRLILRDNAARLFGL